MAGWVGRRSKASGAAPAAGLRMMLVNDYDRLSQIVETDMEAIPTGGPIGADMLDIASVRGRDLHPVAATRHLPPQGAAPTDRRTACGTADPPTLR